MQVVHTSARLVFTCRTRFQTLSSHVIRSVWLPNSLLLRFHLSHPPKPLCLQTQILFGKFRDQKCSSCVTFIYSAQRMFIWGIKIPFVYNIPPPSLQLASNPGGKWMSSGFSRRGWFSLSAALLFSLFFRSQWKKTAWQWIEEVFWVQQSTQAHKP